MPMPSFLRELRERIGHALVLLPGVSALVHDDDGRILCLLRNDNNGWGLPLGLCESREEPAQTVARELWGEAGLVVRPGRVLGVHGAHVSIAKRNKVLEEDLGRQGGDRLPRDPARG